MTAHSPIPDGTPVDMSQVRLGPGWSLQDLYRDLAIARPSLADVPWGAMVLAVTVHVGEGEDGR